MENSFYGLIMRMTAIFLLVECTLVAPSFAMYNFEGVPLKTIAEGQIQGDVLTFSSLGLDAPPRECRFEMPDNAEWARVYTGIWGGTERYKGWVQVMVNGQPTNKTTLYGEDDRNQNVYVSGHGVYWVANDATSLVKKGDNAVSVITSRGETGNKLDGRVYGIVVAALVKKPGEPVTRYWIAEGNENLHGEGWAGTNPTTHHTADVTFKGAETRNVLAANLTTILLASNSGQPDYITFNTHDLGQPIIGSANYPNGSRDIGNERSFDAGGAPGIDSRYMDMEVINVAPYIQDTNTVTFAYGRDLNKDGTISTTGEKPEGEDYIHPCLVMLTIATSGSQKTGPDLLVENIRAVNAYDGENGTITATLRNQGAVPMGPAEIFFRIDQTEIWKGIVAIDQSGIQQITTPWQASGGTHSIEVETRVTGDTDSANNVASTKITVRTPPDLVVSASAPYRSGTTTTQTQKSPSLVLIPIIGIGIVLLLARKHPPNTRALPTGILIVVLILTPILCVPVRASEGAVPYTLPVAITNRGGSDAPSFDLTVYLDGEKAVKKTIEPGIVAGSSQRIDIPVYTSPGRHSVRIVVDESGKVTKKDRSINVFEQSFDFP